MAPARRSWGSTFLVAALVAAGSTPAAAQTGQYSAPGSLALITESASDRVERGAEQAPWRWGPFRFAPQLSLRNVGYDDNVLASRDGEERVEDFHATIGAGLTAYSKLGSETYFSAYLAPEYSWWQDFDALRELNINYGAGAFGTFNKLQYGAQVTSTERERPLSGEAEVPVQILQDQLAIDARVELTPRLALYGRASSTELRYGDSLLEARSDLLLEELASDTERFEAAVAATLRGGLEIGLGVEDRRVDFLADPGGRSNRGTSPVVQMALESDRAHLDLRLVAEETEFDNPDLETFEETTGSALLDFGFSQKTGGAVYFGRSLVYGVLDADSTIEETRFGLSLRRTIGRRLQARFFVEEGDSAYRDSGGPSAGRADDFGAFGTELTMDIGRAGAVTLRYSDTTFDSNFDDFDRSTTRIGVGLELSEGLLPW